MTKLYSGKDVDKKALKKARIAILGYGSQGRAHALRGRKQSISSAPHHRAVEVT